MNINEQQEYKIILQKEKEKIERELNEFYNNFLDKNQKDESGDLSSIDNHSGDMGTEMFDRERNMSIYQNEKNILSEIVIALERIDRGIYGNCEICGKEINKNRLSNIPYASTCIECEKEKQDYQTFKYDRPPEEEILAPFGTYFSDHKNENLLYPGLKSEDIWQQIDRNNKRKGEELNDDDDYIDPDSIIGTVTEPGVVEEVDKISNQYYKSQLP